MQRKIFPLLISTLLITISVITRSEEPKGNLVDTFLAQHAKAVSAAERDSLVNKLWLDAKRVGIPYIAENKTDVVFLYRGNDSVRVIGDFTSWTFRIPMKRVPNSDLWYLKFTFEPDARLDYRFEVTHRGSVLDPNNPRISPSIEGENSELAMPDFTPAPELKDSRKVDKGTLTSTVVGSKVLGYDHKILVYLPAGYDASVKRYPTAYFQDGGAYAEIGSAPLILDNLIATGGMSPTIAVFVVPPEGEKRNRSTEYAMSRNYEKFFATELVPFIDRKYRTESNPQARLIAGNSIGGLMSMTIAINNPDLFGNVACQSGFVSFRNDTLINLFGQSAAKPLRVYFSIGTYEKNVAHPLLQRRETDLLAANRRFAKALEQRSYQFRYREFRDGHSWARWRTDLPNVFRWFFPTGEPN